MKYSGYQITCSCYHKQTKEKYTWSMTAEKPIHSINQAVLLACQAMELVDDPAVRHCVSMLDTYTDSAPLRRSMQCEDETQQRVYFVSLTVMAREEA